jgi:hypothetical protein
MSRTLQKLVDAGTIQPGDVLLFARPGAIQAGIRFAQRRALNDLNAKLGLCQAQVKKAATWTHAAMAYDDLFLAEMTSPKAHIMAFDAIEKGVHVLVRRPVHPLDRVTFANAWSRIIGKDYPESELFYFWFKWASKLAFRRTYAKAFKNNKNHVCSASVVQVMQACGQMHGEPVDAWYPARLAVDGPFVTIAEIVT